MKNDRALAGRKQGKYLVASENGVTLASRWHGGASGGSHGKRGAVKGFSKASARRLRHLLFTLDYSNAVAVTLTHPVKMDGMRGPEGAFKALNFVGKRFPWLGSLIWRKEVTLAGMPHYHCILFPAAGVDGVEAAEKLISAWIDACLGGWVLPTCLEGVRAKYRADMMKAHHDKRPHKKAVQVMDGSCYVRYILDHESKHKQEQSATIGRAWGVWFKDRLPRIEGLSFDLSDEQYWIAARILRKATRYLVKADCVFGRKHSRGRRACGIGRVDYFAARNDGGLAHAVSKYILEGMRSPWENCAPGKYLPRREYPDAPFA